MGRGTVALVGAEFEENLSIRYLASAVAEDGIHAEVIAFDNRDAEAGIVARIVELAPLVVGISVPFQTRAPELLGLANSLRHAGYTGHITIGGHFATFEFAPILRAHPAIDSVARHEGETTFRELCAALLAGADIATIPGLVSRGDAGLEVAPPRPLPSLDTLPFPDRRGRPRDVLGIASAPLVGSRGCYADCAFCCIYAYSDNARGARYRMRSPEAIAAEMKHEYVERGVRLFIFHDDNFFVPSRDKNLARYERLADLLQAAGMDDIGIVIKCRPNDVDAELFSLLRRMGLIRAYVGIETNSDEGIVSLNRRVTSEDNRNALRVLSEIGIYASFNVLIFDPEATLGGVSANLDFMEEFAAVPLNFCRAEVYAGTALKRVLEEQGRLRGDYLAWGYEMRDPRVELLFRISSTAFMSRNFKSDGVASLNMGIRFDNEVLRHFYAEGWDSEWHDRLRTLSTEVNRDSVARMREALAFAAEVDLADHATIKAFTLSLARALARADLGFIQRCRAIRAEIERRVDTAGGLESANPYGSKTPPWAAETNRLGSSAVTSLSNENLPTPNLGRR